MRMRLFATWLLAASSLGFPAFAQPAPYPTQKATTIIVPAVAGGATDIVARIISRHLGKSLDQTVTVENRPGANGNIGQVAVVRAPPDGHTLLLATTNNLATNQFTMKDIGHDPLVDLAPVALVADAPQLIGVSSTLPIRSVSELIDFFRTNSDKNNFGSPGLGSMPHLSGERLFRTTGVKVIHVPYRGAAAALADVATGSVQMTVATLASMEPFRQAGTVRILAVAAKDRLKAIPDVPTLAEAGFKNLEMSGWWCVMAPKGTNPEVVKFLNGKLREAFEDPENVELLGKLGILARSETVETFAKFLQDEASTWQVVIKDMGLQVQ